MVLESRLNGSSLGGNSPGNYTFAIPTAVGTQVRKPLVIVTKKDRLLAFRFTDPKDVKTVIVVTRPLGNLRRMSVEGANEVFHHLSQLVMLPCATI